MADKLKNGNGKHESAEAKSSDGTWAGFPKKTGSVYPKRGESVLNMAAKKIGNAVGKAVVSGAQNIKNNNKIKPNDGDSAWNVYIWCKLPCQTIA